MANAPSKATLVLDPSFTARFPIPSPNVPSGPAPPTFTFPLNPSEIKISGGGEWKEAPANQLKEMATALFQKPKPRTISLSFVVDQVEDASGDVSKELEPLFTWTQPYLSFDRRKASSAHLLLTWGAWALFKCYIESLNVTYTMFSPAGTPVRAKVDLGLKEARDAILSAPTNPTSGGQGGERTHTVAAGDSLHSLAHRYYGHARFWRALAAFNDIDDPQRLRPGRAVNLPEAAAIEELV